MTHAASGLADFSGQQTPDNLASNPGHFFEFTRQNTALAVLLMSKGGGFEHQMDWQTSLGSNVDRPVVLQAPLETILSASGMFAWPF